MADDDAIIKAYMTDLKDKIVEALIGRHSVATPDGREIRELQEYFCFGCGSPRHPVRVHGHMQCSECGFVVERCCDD